MFPQDLLAINEAQKWEIRRALGAENLIHLSWTCREVGGFVSVEALLTNFSEDLTPMCYIMYK